MVDSSRTVAMAHDLLLLTASFAAKREALEKSTSVQFRRWFIERCAAHEHEGPGEDHLVAIAAQGLSELDVDDVLNRFGEKRVAIAMLRGIELSEPSRLLELAVDPDLDVRVKAHEALAAWARACRKHEAARQIIARCIWQWQQDAHRSRRLLIAIRESFEAAVRLYVAGGGAPSQTIRDLPPNTGRGRCVAFEILIQQNIAPDDDDDWIHAVMQGLASRNAGFQRDAAALAVAALERLPKARTHVAIARCFLRSETQSAAADRLAPLLPSTMLLALAQMLDELCSDDSRKCVRAKLAALSRKPELALRSIGRRDLVVASEDGRGDVRVAALCALMCLDDDGSSDRFVAAMRTAVIDDALSFPRREITRAVRRAARQLNCSLKETSRLRRVDIVLRLCEIALEGLNGDDAQQLSACEIFAVLVQDVPPGSALWQRLTKTGVLIDSMLRSSWDRVRRVVYDVLNIIVDSRPLEGISVLVSSISGRLRGPDYRARDAAAKLAALLTRASVEVLPPQEDDDEDTAFWRRAISLSKPAELEHEICERYLLASNLGKSEAAPGALLVFAALAARSSMAANRVLDVVRQALAITRDSLPSNDDTSDDYAENESTMSSREQRGWHLCRSACICVKAYAFGASTETVTACGESLLEDVLLTTRHSGAIAAAQSAFQVAVTVSDPPGRERWMRRCETLCDQPDDRCASRRSAGLASAVVALIEATEDSSIVKRLLSRLDGLATSSTTANLRIMHCLAAAVWRCSRVPESLYARALAAALVRADDASWSVRSASAMLVATVIRKCSAGTARETSTTSRVAMITTVNCTLDGDDIDTGVFARFVGLSETLRDALAHSGRIALFASLNALARFGQDAKRESRLKLAKTLVDSCLAHPCLSIRKEAAAALSAALHQEDFFAAELVSRGLNSGRGPNATHGALLACRRLVDAGAGPATKYAVARAVLQLILLPDLPPISLLEAAAAAAKCADICDSALSVSLSAALEDLYVAALASTRRGCQCDAAPGESFARAELCASAAAARLREPPNAGRLSEVLELLVGPNDECALAITQSAIAFVTTKHLPLDAADDLDIEEVPILDVDSRINPMLVDFSARALLHCHESAPSRRAAALRLALRCASCVMAHADSHVVDQCLRNHEKTGFPDFQAVALQLRAVWWSEEGDCVLLARLIAIAAHDENLPVLLRRGAARALALQPKLLMLRDVSLADRFLIAALKLVVSPDVETRAAAARALAVYCDPERPRGDPRDVGPLAPHVALRSALLRRQRCMAGGYAEFEKTLIADSRGGTSTTTRPILECSTSLKTARTLAQNQESRGQ